MPVTLFPTARTEQESLSPPPPMSESLMPQISVVMSVFNGERFLCQAIDSILAQSFRDFEFIIIDDGSVDSTATILRRYKKEDQRVCIYVQSNLGLVESLNRGCALARGKYIARMDADDVALPGRLLRQFEFLEANSEIGIVGGAVQFIDAENK